MNIFKALDQLFTTGANLSPGEYLATSGNIFVTHCLSYIHSLFVSAGSSIGYYYHLADTETRDVQDNHP